MTGLGFLGVQTGPIVCREDDDFDPSEAIDFAEAFGFTVEQPSERERREHHAARRPCWNCGGSGVRCCEYGRDKDPSTKDPRASDVAGGHDHPNRRFE